MVAHYLHRMGEVQGWKIVRSWDRYYCIAFSKLVIGKAVLLVPEHYGNLAISHLAYGFAHLLREECPIFTFFSGTAAGSDRQSCPFKGFLQGGEELGILIDIEGMDRPDFYGVLIIFLGIGNYKLMNSHGLHAPAHSPYVSAVVGVNQHYFCPFLDIAHIRKSTLKQQF